MNYNKIQNNIIKEVLKHVDGGNATELRLCKEFEFESIIYQPILFNNYSIVFIPHIYYYLDNEKICKRLHKELFDVSKIKIEKGDSLEYIGLLSNDREAFRIKSQPDEIFYFNKVFNKYIDKYDDVSYYIDTTKTFLLCYDLYDRPLIYIMRVKQ